MFTFPQTSDLVKSYVAGYFDRFDYSHYFFPGDPSYPKSDSLPTDNDGSFDYYDFCGSVATLLNASGEMWIIARDLYEINAKPVSECVYNNGFLVNCHTGMVLSPSIDYYRESLSFTVYGLSYEENSSVQPIREYRDVIKFSKFPSPKRLVNRINNELVTDVNIEALALYQSQMIRGIEADKIRRDTLIDLSLDFAFPNSPNKYELKQSRLVGYPKGRERIEISVRHSSNDTKVDLELSDLTVEKARKIAAILTQ